MRTWAIWQHSLLSPYLNNGLLHPEEAIKAALKRFEKGDIPIASAEAFIRQIIGWREYVNGMYWYLGSEYRQKMVCTQSESCRNYLVIQVKPI